MRNCVSRAVTLAAFGAVVGFAGEGRAEGYVSGGALYLPMDEGTTALGVSGGYSTPRGRMEARVGAILGYGSSKYSSSTLVMVEGTSLVWFDTYGLSVAAGVGPVISSKKTSGGWDGTSPGVMLLASPVRLRFGALEPSFDVGILYKSGVNDAVAPFALLSLTGVF